MFTGTLRPFQQPAARQALYMGAHMLALDMGLGKGIPVDSVCHTPTMGLTKMGDIRVGDEVFGSDGRPTRVLGVFPQGVRPTYRVTFSDGSSLDVDDQHVWAVRSPVQKKRGEPYRLLTTEELRQKPLKHKSGNRIHFIPMAEPVVYEEDTALPLDPYVLGVLLGDGALSSGTVSWCKPDEWMAGEVARLLPPSVEVRRTTSKADKAPIFRVVGTSSGSNEVLNALREVGLAGSVSYTKFIPEQYFTGSVEQREALLQGLLDTDGHVRPKDNNIEYSSSSEELARGVSRLVQSLGGTARVRVKKEPTYTYRGEKRAGRSSYRMSVALPPMVRPFRSPTKADVYHPREKYHPSRSIVSIETLGDQETVCIKVAADDGLFVAGEEYVVTHNTPTTLAITEDLLECGDADQGLWITLASLKYQALGAVREFTTSDGLVVEGTKAQRARIYDQARIGKWPYIILNYEQPRDEPEEVQSLPRDFIVCDEVTALASFKSKRGRATKRLDAPYKIALTGTPIENRLEDLFSIMEWIDPSVLGRWDLFDRTFIVRARNGMPVRYRNIPLIRERMEPYWTRITHAEVADQLPRIEQGTLPVRLDPSGARVYRFFSQELLETLTQAREIFGPRFDIWGHHAGEDAESNRIKGQIMSRLLAARMVCAHPELLRISAEKYEDSGGRNGSEYLAKLRADGQLDALPKTSPKLRALVDRLRTATESGHKVVVFSGWVEMLNLMLDTFSSAKPRLPLALPYHGGLSQREREHNKQRFKTEDDVGILVSSDAGGYGVDLPEGKWLVNYDLPWGAGRMSQRNARIIRISSEHEHINIVDMVVLGTVEAWIQEKVNVKKLLGGAVVDGRGIDSEGRVDATGGSLLEFLDENDPLPS